MCLISANNAIHGDNGPLLVRGRGGEKGGRGGERKKKRGDGMEGGKKEREGERGGRESHVRSFLSLFYNFEGQSLDTS